MCLLSFYRCILCQRLRVKYNTYNFSDLRISQFYVQFFSSQNFLIFCKNLQFSEFFNFYNFFNFYRKTLKSLNFSTFCKTCQISEFLNILYNFSGLRFFQFSFTMVVIPQALFLLDFVIIKDCVFIDQDQA